MSRDARLTSEVLDQVRWERDRQHFMWGRQRYGQLDRWLTILLEEVGEVARAILEDHDIEEIRDEFVQVAAVAVAATEEVEEDLRARDFPGERRGAE